MTKFQSILAGCALTALAILAVHEVRPVSASESGPVGRYEIVDVGTTGTGPGLNFNVMRVDTTTGAVSRCVDKGAGNYCEDWFGKP